MTEKSCNLLKNEWTYHENEELEPVQPGQMNIYQSNTTYRKHLIWIHFDSEPSVQERHQVRGGQPYISVSIVYLKYPRSSNIEIAISCPSLQYLKFKFRIQLQLVPQSRCLMIVRVECSIISTDSDITHNIISKVISIKQKRCRTTNGALRDSSISQIFWKTRSRLLLKKDKIRPNTQLEIP